MASAITEKDDSCRRRPTFPLSPPPTKDRPTTTPTPSTHDRPPPPYTQIDHLSAPFHSQHSDLDHLYPSEPEPYRRGPTHQKIHDILVCLEPVNLIIALGLLMLNYKNSKEEIKSTWFWAAIHIGLPALFLGFAADKVRKAYKGFLDLGPGGTPSTFAGFCRVKLLSLFALKDPTFANGPSMEEIQGKLKPERGILDIPHRTGQRPEIEGVAPQRQQSQFPPHELYFRFRTALLRAGREDERLETKTSCFEKQGLALFAKKPYRVNSTCKGEICHVHAIDGSLHLNLHPADMRTLCSKGWGQRHPLAGRRPCWSHFIDRLGWYGFRWSDRASKETEIGKGKAVVPSTFCLVYAPRMEDELEVLGSIVEAAAWWVMGGPLHLDIPPSTSSHAITEEDAKVFEEKRERVRKGEFATGQWKDSDLEEVRKLKAEAGIKEDDRLPGWSMDLEKNLVELEKVRAMGDKVVAMRLLLAKIEGPKVGYH